MTKCILSQTHPNSYLIYPNFIIHCWDSRLVVYSSQTAITCLQLDNRSILSKSCFFKNNSFCTLNAKSSKILKKKQNRLPSISMTAFLVLSLPWVLELSPVMRLCRRLAVVTTLQPIMEYITTSDTIGTTKNTIEENS